MKKFSIVSFIIVILFLTGCKQDKYDNNDVAAIVNDKEVTVEEIRWLHSLEDESLEQLVRSYVKEEIMVQEAMKMGVDVSHKVEEELKGYSLPAEPPQGKENPILDFYKKQADKLDMSPEEYGEFYIEKSTERREYTKKYIENEIGKPAQSEDIEYHDKLNKMYDNLLTKYQDNIDILIK
ncbi:hypothetical protein [Aquibacillus sediminis]|uniref:hypothetical protein n=1 Tax=Aquibacillus sediminis TaxID=2574734 RepID=UPI001109E5B1|nr:hypothetical protein [Aquibacillus sediminis]